MCLRRRFPGRWRGLLIAPGVKPVTVVLSVATEDIVNAESQWAVNCSEPCQTVVGVRRREAAGYQADDEQVELYAWNCDQVAVAVQDCWIPRE